MGGEYSDFIERRALHKSIDNLRQTVEARRHIPARKRAELQNRTARAFDAVYGKAWRD